MNSLARISALLRELADAVDDYAQEKRPKQKVPRKAGGDSAAARHAVELVQRNLRHGGIRS